MEQCRATCSLNSVSGHLHLSHKNLGLTPHVAPDSEPKQSGEMDSSTGMKPSFSKMRKDGPSFQQWESLP